MIVDVPNLGRFRLPEGLSESDVRLLLRGLYREAGVEYPDVRTYGEKFQAGLSRGAQQLLVSATNDLPALGLAALADAGFGGYQDKARQFLEEGAAKYAQIEADYPTAHPDILQAKGPGDVLGFAVENIGQGLPSILSMIGTGGVGGLVARKLAMRSANQMIEEQLKRGVAADALKRMGEKEIARRTMLGAGIGAGGTSFAQAAPEAFRTIYEETKQLAPEEAIIAGGINAMLDSLVPAKVLGELGLFGRMKLTEQVAKKSGFLPTAARVGAEAIKTAGIEGLTETAQTFVNNVAVKFIDSNFDVFSPENVRKYVNSFAAGVSAGSVPGAVGATFKEFGRPAPPEAPPEVPSAVPPVQPTPVPPIQPPPVQPTPVPPIQPPPVQPTPVPPIQPPPVQPTPVPPIQPTPVPPVPPVQPTPVPPVPPVQPTPVPPVVPPVQPSAPGQPALPASTPVTAPVAPPVPSGEPPQLPAPPAPPTEPPTAPPMSYQDFLAAQQRRISPEGRKVQLLQGQKPKRQLPENLQPRDRDALFSISQMQNLANKPDARRLAESRTFTDGAPMVIGPSDDWDTTFAGGKEDVAISDNIEVPFRYAFISASSSMVAPSHDADGTINKKYQSTPFVPITNGRIAGLQQSYQNIAQGKQGALKYKEDILKIGEQLGLKRPTYVDPILVRVVRPKDVPAEIGDISNRSQALELSPAEIAKQDANRIADVVETFEFDSKGNPSDETINKFVSRMPKNEANQLIQKTGRGIEPTQLAEQRIKRAVFAAAYNDNTLIEMLSNAPPSAKEDALNVQNAMMRAASAMVKLRGTGEYDIRKFVVEAAKDAINAKRANIKISEYAKIPVIEERPPIQQVLLEFFGNNIRRGNYMATELIDTANTLLEEHENTAPDMFGESTQRPPLLVVQQIGQKEEEGKLFNRVNVQEETGAGSAPIKYSRQSQINTPEFQKWFGDSKVVDANGKPLVVYHGTNKSQDGVAFTKFDTYGSNYGLMGQGSYFTAEPMIASEYTRKGRGDTPTVYPVYLSIQNPIDMDARADSAAWIAQFPDAEAFHEGGDTNESWYRAAEDAMRDAMVPAYEGAEAMQEGLRAMGYDGIKHVGGGRYGNNTIRHRVYIAFDPEQIKSAIGNRGTFDPKNPDILQNIINATDPITKPPPESVPDMFEKYREELDRMGLSDVRLEMFNPDFTDKYLSIGEYTEQWGEKLNIIRIIRIALTTDEARKKYPQYFNKQRLSRTLHHEAVHAMRSMELFTDQEWKILSTASKNDWIKRIWDVGDKPIEELYKDRSYEMIIEEGVARAFEHYTQGRFRPAGIIATIFNKIRNFFEEVVGFAKKHNFTKEQADIFERMLSGEIGRRPRVQTVGPEKLDKILYNAATADIKKESMNNLVNSGPPLSSIKDKAKDLVTDLAADKAEYILGAFNLRQLGELAEKDLPQINTYYKTVGEMTGFRDGRITKAADIAQDWIAWAQKNPKLNHDLATCMHGSTLSGLDFNTQFTKIKSLAYQQAWLRVAADPKAVEIYKNVQKYYDESFDMLKSALIERIEKDVEAGKTKTARLIAIEDAFTKARDGGPYFPLVRFGDYWVSVKQQGEKEKFYMFESRSEHRKFIDKLSQSGLKEGTDFKAGLKAREMLQSGVPLTGFIRTVMDSVDSLTKDGAVTDTEKLKDSVWQAYLALQPDLSTRKQFIHRKNIEGYSNDAIRAFAETTFHGAYHLARVKYGGELDRILLDANRSVRQSPGVANARYLDELKKRHDWVNAPNDINNFSSWASSAAFLYFLTAPASALVNIAQTPMVAYPYLGARYGFTEAFGAFASATKDYWASGFTKKDFYNIIRTLEKRTKDKQLSDKARKTAEQEMLAMQRLYEDGTLNRTQTLSLAGIAERPQDILVGGLGSAMKTAGLKFQDKMTYALGYGFNQAEVFNRQTTALAAYRLARKNKKSHDEAIEEARKVVNETHFEYINATKPRFMQGPTARIIFQFKNYAQQMTMLYVRSLQQAFAGESKEVKREARRRLTAMLFMTGVFAGYEGLPLYWVIEGTMNALFDDEDEPYDFNNSAKNTLADMFGSNVALALSKGVVSELTGADIASRVSQNGMWFRDSAKSVDEVEAFKQFVVDLAGPFVGIGVNIADGIKKINDGYTWRGIEAMLPPVLKDFLKVGRMSQEGATTLRGDPIVEEVSTWGLFLQALGFTPVDVARGYEVMAEIKGMDRDLDQRRKQLLQQITLAQINGDYQAYNEISDKIITFNSKNPNNPITTESIKRSLAQRVKDTDRALRGIIVNPKREYLLEEARYTD